MTPFICTPTGKKILSRCGDKCRDRTMHEVMAYDFEGKKWLALSCRRCGVVTVTFTPFPEEIHGFIMEGT
jgi:hypothetical protein